MKSPVNPRIAWHTSKLDLARICLSPITYKYLTLHNNKRTINKAKLTSKSTVNDLLNIYNENELKPEELLKNFAKIPYRNSKKTTEIIPNIHLSFKLLWTQLALINVRENEHKHLHQIVINVQDELLNKAIEAMRKLDWKTTLIRALLKNTNQKLPSNIKYWAVFEKGSKQDGDHIHVVAALDSQDKQIITKALSNFECVRFKDHTSVDCNKSYIDIDIGAAYYFAKSINKKYYGSNNLYVSPVLIKESKVVESKYRGFIAENKAFLLNDKKASQRSLQAYEQRRINARPKTYEEWEELTINQPTEELDTTVYWQEVD